MHPGGMRPMHPVLRPRPPTITHPRRERLFFRGRGFFPWGWWDGWGWWPWGYYDPVYPTCRAWSNPIALTPDLAMVGGQLLAQNNNEPAAGVHNDQLYLFTMENGAVTVRVCTAQ
jgi:hypothetical protein